MCKSNYKKVTIGLMVALLWFGSGAFATKQLATKFHNRPMSAWELMIFSAVAPFTVSVYVYRTLDSKCMFNCKNSSTMEQVDNETIASINISLIECSVPKNGQFFCEKPLSSDYLRTIFSEYCPNGYPLYVQSSLQDSCKTGMTYYQNCTEYKYKCN